MLNKEDLLKFTKNVELRVVQIEDDSSDRTEVKILHLENAITATGSIPTPEGKEMKVISNKLYIAADDIEEFLKDAESKDGAIVYKGSMHLDVSKPQGRNDANGDYVITKPAKVWLTKTKFSRSGGNLRAKAQTSLSTLINNMFSSKPLDLTVDAAANTAADTSGGNTTAANGAAGQTKKQPEAVATK